MKQILALMLALILIPACSGCGGPSDDRCPLCEQTGSVIDSTKAGVVKGRVTFKGTPPKRAKLELGSSAECSALHSDPVLDETVMVENGALLNVVVYVKSGLSGLKFATPKDVITIENKGCMYVPHVVAAQAHQQILVKNSDPAFHNVNIVADQKVNFGMISSATNNLRFHRAQVAKLNCDVHPWMRGQLLLFDHPYFAVTGKDGTFELKNLPAGEYEIEAWHERSTDEDPHKKLAVQVQKIKLEEKGTVELNFEFELK